MTIVYVAFESVVRGGHRRTRFYRSNEGATAYIFGDAWAGELKLYCKGADSVIYSRLAGGAGARFAAGTLAHLEQFACEGLRTLVFAVADVPERFYQVPPATRLIPFQTHTPRETNPNVE
jgi:magnesium-transporting ATPase (P-type)